MLSMLTTLEAVKKVAEAELIHLGIIHVRVRVNPRKWSTYHREARNGAVLSFGGKMVQLHLDCSGRDLVIREMERFGFGKDLGWSVASELACVILHEISHAIQVSRGERLPHSVHNPAFYRIYRELVGLRAQDVALALAERLGSEALQERPPQAKLPRRPRGSSEVAQYRKALRYALADVAPNKRTPFHSYSFRKGMAVEFDYNGKVLRGRIERRGSKRWTVRAEDGRKFYIPERLLRKC